MHSPQRPSDRPARRGHDRERGFTLVEIMVVVIVLAIMAGIVVPRLTGITSDAKMSTAKANLKTLKGGIDRFELAMGRLPTAEEGLDALLTAPEMGKDQWKGPYLDEMPLDPWGNEFVYRVPGADGKRFDLLSLGADGVEGGEEANADISVWTRRAED